MTPTEALELSKQFPENRNVPRRIANAMKKTRGDDRKKYEQIVEGLYVDCFSIEDIDLMDKYFDN